MVNVYEQDRCGSTNRPMIIMPPMRDAGEVRSLAEAAAKLGHRAFYRVFEQTPGTATGQQFLTAFSVINGVVREHSDVSIPSEHW